MAVVVKNPIFPLNRVVRRFMTQTLNQLEVNAMTQHVYPAEIYNGYSIVNAKRKDMNSWYATGEGAKSFKARVVSADEAGNVTLVFSFNDYMRFVDMGVGLGTKYEDVQGSKKANFKRRYITRWDRKRGQSQRPAIMMELRHLSKRISDYLMDFYGYEMGTRVIRTFEEINPIKLDF